MAPPPVCFMKGTAWRVVMTMDLRSISMTLSQTSRSISTSDLSRPNHSTPAALTT